MGSRIVVVGGGLAGMAAAVALESAGHQVTLLEARRRLGGRAGSFEDPQTGEILDNCQHVLLGCCTNLIDFYRRIGALGQIHWEDKIYFHDARGQYRLWGLEGVPAPFNLALSGLTFAALTPGERLDLSSAMLAMLRLGRAGREKLADVSFGDWLAEHKQPASLIDKFYDLVLVSALNEKCRAASAAAAIKVFQEGLLEHSEAYRMGTPACTLSQLYERLPCGDVRLGTRAGGIRFENGQAIGVDVGEEFIAADAVILAVNYPVLEKWIPPDLFSRDSRFAHLAELQSVPILGAHLWFDRPVIFTSHAALIDGPLQWLFRKPGSDGSALHGVISAARDWLQRDKQEMLDIFIRQIGRMFPHAREAKLLRSSIVVEKRATFSPLPGTDRLRPPQAPPEGGIGRLILAGDFTKTGWPATMEGAVRSGYMAAEAATNRRDRFLQPDLEPQWAARLFSLW